MLQSLLTQEYFENIVPVIVNKYVKYNSYDEANPIITQTYDNNAIPLIKVLENKNTKKIEKKAEEKENEEEVKNVELQENLNECYKLKKISSGIWGKCFPSKFKENEYNKNYYCTFLIILDLIEKKTGKKINPDEIKNILYKEYTKYLQDFYEQIIDNLILEGKNKLGKKVERKGLKVKKDKDMISFDTFIHNSEYFLTIFDIWLLVQKYEIPTIFISSTPKPLEKYTKELFFIGYGEENDDFVFIIVPGIGEDKIPNFGLIKTINNEVFISLDNLLDCEFKNKICAHCINEVKKINDGDYNRSKLIIRLLRKYFQKNKK
jgi:hypothetical protein